MYLPKKTRTLMPLSADYRCIINEITKSDAASLLQNADLTEVKSKIKRLNKLLQHIKWVKKL